ncbi:MAG: putative transport system permease protein [Firmicutes bacterium]|nr:putative transport system permease protein [Bacillota bacterium]
MYAARLIVAALMGGLSSILTHEGIAIFHDGLRPLMPELLEGRMQRRELAVTAFAMSFGLVIGYGLPLSITAGILLIHTIFLATDLIGIASPNRYIAGIAGALWGVGIVVGIQAIVHAFTFLPVNFLPGLGQVGAATVAAFAVFPAVAVGLQFGWARGLITLTLQAVAVQIATVFNPIPIGRARIPLNPEGAALIVGMLMLVIFATRVRAAPGEEGLAHVFRDRVKRIRRNTLILAVMGGLVGAASNLLLVAGDPISLTLLASGDRTGAAIAALARAVGYVPLVATTAIATGVYGPAGLTFAFGVGLLLPNPILAFVAGAVIIVAEVQLLALLSGFLDLFPGMREAGGFIRSAMSQVLEIALLAGGMIAGNAIAPGLGFFVVSAVIALNEIAGSPVSRLAIGPVAALVTGVLVNLLHVVGLFRPPVH